MEVLQEMHNWEWSTWYTEDLLGLVCIAELVSISRAKTERPGLRDPWEYRMQRPHLPLEHLKLTSDLSAVP